MGAGSGTAAAADGVAASLPSLRRRREGGGQARSLCSSASASAPRVDVLDVCARTGAARRAGARRVPRRSARRSARRLPTPQTASACAVSTGRDTGGAWQRRCRLDEPVAPGPCAGMGRRSSSRPTVTIRSTCTAEDDAGRRGVLPAFIVRRPLVGTVVTLDAVSRRRRSLCGSAALADAARRALCSTRRAATGPASSSSAARSGSTIACGADGAQGQHDAAAAGRPRRASGGSSTAACATRSGRPSGPGSRSSSAEPRSSTRSTRSSPPACAISARRCTRASSSRAVARSVRQPRPRRAGAEGADADRRPDRPRLQGPPRRALGVVPQGVPRALSEHAPVLGDHPRRVRRRLPRFDFGRSTRGSGTYRFKCQWGAQEESVFWYTIPDPAAATAVQREPAAGPRRSSSGSWRHLPLAFTRHRRPPHSKVPGPMMRPRRVHRRGPDGPSSSECPGADRGAHRCRRRARPDAEPGRGVRGCSPALPGVSIGRRPARRGAGPTSSTSARRPAAHFDAARAALEGGAHVYVEKPFALTVGDARALLDLAAVAAAARLRRTPAPSRPRVRDACWPAPPDLGDAGPGRQPLRVPAGRGIGGPQRCDGARADSWSTSCRIRSTRWCRCWSGSRPPPEPIELAWVQAGPADLQAVLRAGDLTAGSRSACARGRSPRRSRSTGTRGSLTCDFVRSIVVGAANPGTEALEKILNPMVEGAAAPVADRSAAWPVALRSGGSYPGLRRADRRVLPGGRQPAGPRRSRRRTCCASPSSSNSSSARIEAAARQPRLHGQARGGPHGAARGRDRRARIPRRRDLRARSPRVRGIGRGGRPDDPHDARMGGRRPEQRPARRMPSPAPTSWCTPQPRPPGGYAAHQRNTIDATRHLLHAMHAAGVSGGSSS